jgi:hypothetical protein
MEDPSLANLQCHSAPAFVGLPRRRVHRPRPSSSSSSSFSISQFDDDDDKDEDDHDVSFRFPIRPQAGGPTDKKTAPAVTGRRCVFHLFQS